MKYDAYVQGVALVIVLTMMGCQKAEEGKYLTGGKCIPYVNQYLTARKYLVNGDDIERSWAFLHNFTVHPSDTETPEKFRAQLSKYAEYEKQIKKVTEYSALCNYERDEAFLWFKMEDANPRRDRLRMSIIHGKIDFPTKESTASSNKIDEGKVYVKLNPEQNVNPSPTVTPDPQPRRSITL